MIPETDGIAEERHLMAVRCHQKRAGGKISFGSLFIPYPYDYDRHCHKVGQVKALRLQCKAKYEVGFLR